MNFELNFQFSIFSFQLSLGVRYAPGFPLYLCSLLFSPRSKYLQIPKSPFPNPNSQLRSQRMPLQSLTLWGLLKNNFQLSIFNFQLSTPQGVALRYICFALSGLTAHCSRLIAIFYIPSASSSLFS